MRWLLAFHRDEDATTAVEYAVMLALIIMVCVVTISAMGQALGTKYTNIDGQIQAHTH